PVDRRAEGARRAKAPVHAVVAGAGRAVVRAGDRSGASDHGRARDAALAEGPGGTLAADAVAGGRARHLADAARDRGALGAGVAEGPGEAGAADAVVAGRAGHVA